MGKTNLEGMKGIPVADRAAEYARRKAVVQAAANEEKLRRWPATLAAQMRWVANQPCSEDTLPQERALRAVFDRDQMGFLEKLVKMEAEAARGGVDQLVGSIPDKPPPDAETARLRGMIRGLLEEIGEKARAR